MITELSDGRVFVDNTADKMLAKIFTLEAEVYNLKQKNKSLEEENKLLKEAVRAGVQNYTAGREECIRCGGKER